MSVMSRLRGSKLYRLYKSGNAYVVDWVDMSTKSVTAVLTTQIESKALSTFKNAR